MSSHCEHAAALLKRQSAATFGVAAVAMGMIVALAAIIPGKSLAAGCANEPVRGKQESTFLPDCRAYELVSPGSSPFLERAGSPEGARASLSGGGIAYYSPYPAKGASRGGFYYLATRSAVGWATTEVAPQDSPEGSEELACLQSVYFSADLTGSVLSDGWNAEEEKPGESYCQSSEERLAAEAASGYGDLFFRESSGPYQLVNITPESAIPGNARLEDLTANANDVLFGEDAQLTPEALAGYNLYEWSGGAVHLITFLPDGTPVLGRLADGGAHGGTEGVFEGHFYALAPVTHAASADGERVFFYAEHEGSVNLYLRENAAQPPSEISGGQCTESEKACTIEIDRTQGSGASGGGVFWDASENGSRVFFADESKLTGNSGASAGRPDLYEFDVESGRLTDLTPPSAGEAASVRGFSGASENGAYVYFVAKGVLTQAQKNAQGAAAQRNAPNLYLCHEGALTFVATLNAETDGHDWQEEFQPPHELNMGALTARVSPDGLYLGFNSSNEITGFNNGDATTGNPDSEVFVYEAETGQLNCVSCAAGVQPLGNTELPGPTRFSQKPGGAPVYLSRNVLDDGRVFFTTPNALVSQDTNGVDDAYEYEGGQSYLISSGRSSAGSTFYDASANGADVFFVTSEGLVRSDTDNNDSLYDARAQGGFPPGAGETGESESCESEATCKPPPGEGATGQPPASALFSGPGNLVVPPPKGEGPTAKGAAKPTLTRAQKLADALKACRGEAKRKRRSCEAAARSRFGAKRRTKHKHKGGEQ